MVGKPCVKDASTANAGAVATSTAAATQSYQVLGLVLDIDPIAKVPAMPVIINTSLPSSTFRAFTIFLSVAVVLALTRRSSS